MCVVEKFIYILFMVKKFMILIYFYGGFLMLYVYGF